MKTRREPRQKGVQTNLDWDVEKINVLNKYGEIPDYSNIVRTDNHATLSIMGKDYTPMSNKEFKENVKELSSLSGFPVEGYVEFREGKVVLCFLKNTKGLIHIGSHPVQDYFLIGNSFDGSNSFFIGTTTEFLRCENQFTRISKIAKIRHSKNFEEKVKELKTYLEIFLEDKKKVFHNFQRFEKQILSDEVKTDLVNFVMGLNKKEVLDPSLISTKKMNQIITLNDCIKSETEVLGQNLWGLFNGITYYTTHEMNSKDNVFGNPFGNPQKMNEKAYQFLCNSIYNQPQEDRQK